MSEKVFFMTKSMVFLIIITVFGVLPLAANSASAADKKELSDSEIAEAVEDELLLDAAVLEYRIDVVSNEGVVTLAGVVDNILAKERAVRIAETVKGVRAVVDKIDVRSDPNLSDKDIEKMVETALLMDPAADWHEIEVETGTNEIALSGKVDSYQERHLAEKVAKGVKGVEKVDNNIVVIVDTTRTDREIEAEVEKTLHWSTMIDDGLVEVEVENGQVVLAGSVGSASEKRMAMLKSYVAGVKTVDASGLNVAKWARDDDLRKQKYVAKSDLEILDAVKDALVYDPRVMSFDVTPKVTNGFVTLRGTVDNLKAKNAAGDDARNVVGVIGVKNRIKVSPASEPKPEDVVNSIERAFFRDPILESYQIDVAFSYGIAKLSGTADTYYERARAEEIASGVEGVVAVDNNLAVLNVNDRFYYEPYVTEIYPRDYVWYRQSMIFPGKSDTRIKNDIKDELFWSPFVDENQVDVEVDEGTASLTGTVDSWMEYDAAEENAYEGGAVFVDNDLIVSFGK